MEVGQLSVQISLIVVVPLSEALEFVLGFQDFFCTLGSNLNPSLVGHNGMQKDQTKNAKYDQMWYADIDPYLRPSHL